MLTCTYISFESVFPVKKPNLSTIYYLKLFNYFLLTYLNKSNEKELVLTTKSHKL